MVRMRRESGVWGIIRDGGWWGVENYEIWLRKGGCGVGLIIDGKCKEVGMKGHYVRYAKKLTEDIVWETGVRE